MEVFAKYCDKLSLFSCVRFFLSCFSLSFFTMCEIGKGVTLTFSIHIVKAEIFEYYLPGEGREMADEELLL